MYLWKFLKVFDEKKMIEIIIKQGIWIRNVILVHQIVFLIVESRHIMIECPNNQSKDLNTIKKVKKGGKARKAYIAW